MSFRTSSPAWPSRATARREQAKSSGSRESHEQYPRFLSRGDAYLMDRVPGWKPQTEEEFKESLKSTFGEKVTDDNIHEYIQAYNTAVEQVIQGPGINVMGVKPQPGDRNVYTVSIPDSDFVIRMWDGGMALYRQFCLDVYDTCRRTPVNLPRSFSLWSGVTNVPGAFTTGGQLGSWENAFGWRGEQIPPGEEKWSVPEGSCVTLKRCDRPDFTFAVPIRQMQYQEAIAQPVLGAPY